MNLKTDSDLSHKSQAAEVESLRRALDFERRRSQGLEAEIAALCNKLKSSAPSLVGGTDDTSQKRALGVMRDALVATKFRTLRTVIPLSESFTGSRNVVIPWEEITPRSVIHVSVCEAAEIPNLAAEHQIGIPGDAPILVRGAVCGKDVVVANIHVDWVKPLPLLINITLLATSSEFVFCNVDPQRSLIATPEIENMFQAQIHNLMEIEVGSDDDFVEWIYRRILRRAPDEGGKTFWMQNLQQGQTTRVQMVMTLFKSGEYEAKKSY